MTSEKIWVRLEEGKIAYTFENLGCDNDKKRPRFNAIVKEMFLTTLGYKKGKQLGPLVNICKELTIDEYIVYKLQGKFYE